MRSDVIICRGEGITLGKILHALDAGAVSPNEVKIHTRAGMGVCQSRTCRPLITDVIRERLGFSTEESGVLSYRPPTRPVTLEDMAGSDET